MIRAPKERRKEKMSYVRRKGDKGMYWMLDRRCIGRECFSPGQFQHRGATLSGSRNTGGYSLTCMRNAYHGCPDDPDKLYSIDLQSHRNKEGWKNV
jgi:hypothetical protein